MEKKSLRWNGWGRYEAPDVLGDHAEEIWNWLATHFGLDKLPHTPAVSLEQAALPESKLSPAHLAALSALSGAEYVLLDDYERAYHARGRSYHDLLHLRMGRLDTAPDAVVYPASVAEVQALVEYASAHGLALVPYGGGSSVVGGVTPSPLADHEAILTMDMARMNRILDINKTAMIAHIEAGIYGPKLEQELQDQGVTLGHYPQSFEYSTLGGWIASRGAGHQSNQYGKAEDWLAAATLATPKGIWRTENFPASAAGPMLRDLTPGSEGVYGIITDAHVRIHVTPAVKDYRAWFFTDFNDGLTGVRTLLQQGVPTAMVRLSDPGETFFYSVLHGGAEVAENGPMGFCLMLVGLEGEEAEVAHARERVQAILGSAGGAEMGSSLGKMWLTTRFDTPYLRDPMLDRGLGVDTLETATTWDKLPALYAGVMHTLETAIRDNQPDYCSNSMVMAHLSHSYRTGASLYFTFVFPRKTGGEIEQWRRIKQAATDAIVAAGGTLSHHHGVGLDHLPWLAAEKGPVASAVLTQIKECIDPKHTLNPGKLALPRE